MTEDTVDWAAVQAAYEAGEMPQKEIWETFKVTAAKIRYRRQSEHWAMPTKRRVARGTLITAMMRVLAKQIETLEKQMPEQIDKEATLLGTMAKTLEKLIQLEKGEAGQRPVQKDLSALRLKVAKRLEQLSQRNELG